MPHSIFIQILLILCSTALLAAAIYLLSVYKRLFSGVRNLWLRRNLAVLSVALLVMSALLALQSPEILSGAGKKGFAGLVLKQLAQMFFIVLFVFNVVWMVSRIPAIKRMSFIKHHAVVIL
jgi:hypothetical protein